MSTDPSTTTGPPKDTMAEQKPVASEATPAASNPHGRDSIVQEGEWHKTHHDFGEHGHNPSLQKDVQENPDLALRYSHEHQHQHLHHGRNSLSGRHDDILYAKGVDASHIPPQDYSHHHTVPENSVDSKDQRFSVTDAEKGDLSPSKVSTNEGERAGRKYRFSGFYSKYKIFFHLFIWLFFTG